MAGVASLLSGSRLDQLFDVFRQIGIGLCGRSTVYRWLLLSFCVLLYMRFWWYNKFFCLEFIQNYFRMLADYINPIVYGFWTDMQRELLLQLATLAVAIEVTGDGQVFVDTGCLLQKWFWFFTFWVKYAIVYNVAFVLNKFKSSWELLVRPQKSFKWYLLVQLSWGNFLIFFFFQFDNAGFMAGCCFYAIVHVGTKKVIAFIVTTKDMVSYSALMGMWHKNLNSLLGGNAHEILL